MHELNSPIKYRTNPIRLVFYAVFFSIMLFLLLPLSRMFQNINETKEIVRSIELAATPPPPPILQQQEEDLTIEEVVNIQRIDAEIELEPLDVQLDASLEGDLQVKISIGNFNVSQSKEGLLADIKMFSLLELDSTPMSLNDPLLRIPAELITQGISEINAEALVILTEEGKVEFVQFISLSHQDANKIIREYIQKLRYTPPTKDGEVGRVRFRLPVRIRDLVN